MTWSAIVRDADGELVSVGDVVADGATLAAKGYVRMDIAGPPGTDLWDKVTRTFFARPPAPALLDRIEEIVNDVDLAGLLNTALRKNTARAALAKYLPTGVRFHVPGVLD